MIDALNQSNPESLGYPDAPRRVPQANLESLGTRLIRLAQAAAAEHQAQRVGGCGRGREERPAGVISFHTGQMGDGGVFLQARTGAIHWEVEP